MGLDRDGGLALIRACTFPCEKESIAVFMLVFAVVGLVKDQELALIRACQESAASGLFVCKRTAVICFSYS